MRTPLPSSPYNNHRARVDPLQVLPYSSSSLVMGYAFFGLIIILQDLILDPIGRQDFLDALHGSMFHCVVPDPVHNNVDGHVAERAPDEQAAFSDRPQVSAPGNEDDLVPATRQPGAEVAPDSAGTDDRDSQNSSSIGCWTGI